MNIALGSDLRNELTAALERELLERGHQVLPFGVLAGGQRDDWPAVGRAVGNAVASGACTSGIACCWTGTGVSIAANKVAGVRAALCGDAATAAGAREWNDANVLCLSLRTVSVPLAREILDAWFAGGPTSDPTYRRMIDEIATGEHAPS
ncbi:MAG: RpiB/LacA/LacB family sugar-phosphate isomerase [Vulcanimicrobiaceae bacterium]